MKKKLYISFSIALLLGMGSFHFLMAENSNRQADLILAQIEALASNETGGGGGWDDCIEGGPGAFACSYEWTVNTLDEFGNVISSETQRCDVSCSDGYYACCSGGGCHCKVNKI